MGKIHIGISGWRYLPWRGVFYPPGLFELRDKLGPFLWQFPQMVKFEPERFERFSRLLPQDTESALALARQYQPRMEGKVSLAMRERRPMRHAVEIRHESFRDERFIALLRKYNIALVAADTAGRWPYIDDVTADFVYIRLHGDKELYASGYGDEAIARWAARIQAWSKGGQLEEGRVSPQAPANLAGRDVYCYFDNDIKVHAPYDAQRLIAALGADPSLDVAGLAPARGPGET